MKRAAIALALLLSVRAGAECPDCADGEVTIDELVTAVGLALNGCPMPTPTVTPIPATEIELLEALLGTWRFEANAGGRVEVQRFVLDDVNTTTREHPVLFGRDVAEPGIVAVFVTALSPPRFRLVNPREFDCSVFDFSHPSADMVTGELIDHAVPDPGDPFDTCGEPICPECRGPMTGVRE